MNKVDVAILGGGLSGNLLARQLRKEAPHLSVAIFERSEERAYKVGESTVEIASDYLIRKQGLSTYIYQEHLPKNGLRFFFDNEAKNAPLADMSEIGLDALPPYPSFQLDRARLERDLLEMNRKDGVSVNLCVRVKDVVLDKSGDHRVLLVDENTPDEKDEFEVRARWVIDATGRANLLSKKLDLRVEEKDHRVAAVWGRFKNVKDIDQVGDDAWRARVRYTARSLSTNHFCYNGYWIWFIPLRNGIVSVGAVCERDKWKPGMHKEEGFRAFLNQHAAVKNLISDAEMIDVEAFTQLSFRTKKFYGDARWALLGDACAFADPFYSPGSDFIALECDQTCDLIKREAAGEDIDGRTEAYNEFMQLRFEAALALYRDLYSTFGSYALFRAKCFFDCACYYNLWFDSFARDEHLDLSKVRGFLRRGDQIMGGVENFGKRFMEARDRLLEEGRYFEKNLNHADVDGSVFGADMRVGEKRKRREITERTYEIFIESEKRIADALGDTEPTPLDIEAYVARG